MNRAQIILLVLFVLITNALICVMITQSQLDKNGMSVEDQLFYSKKSLNDSIDNERQNAITKAVSIIEPSVVSVNVVKTQIVRGGNSPFGNPFFDLFDFPMQREVQSIGSGVIINPEGYIVTNSHVVDGAATIKVVLYDGRELDGKLIGQDVRRDLAVVKIEDKNLPYALLGNSDNLLIGEWSIALGNPYGFLMNDSKPTVSVGVISAVNRSFAGRNDGKVYKDMIQTDAAINPGNSGGPLVNILGEVIGINTFIFSENGGSVGIGFAIPVNQVKKIAKEIIRNGKVREIYYGFKVQDLNPNLIAYFDLKSGEGAMVAQIDPRSAANKAGLALRDIIISCNENKVKSAKDLELALSDLNVGDEISFQVIRGKQVVSITIKAEAK